MNTINCLNYNLHTTKVRSAIKRLTLVNFRNYKYLRINTDSSFVVLYGENGTGKTNILEAISFLSPGRGLRNAKLSEVKTFDFMNQTLETPVFINNKGWAVSANIKRDNEDFNIGTSVETTLKEIDYNETKEIERRIIHINNEKISLQSELNNYLSIIWVTPQMDRVFQTNPQNRRNFLDRIVCSFDAEHTKRLSIYDNIYRQWLQILKSDKINDNWLFSIEEKIAENGIAIAAARKEQVEKLNMFIKENPDDIFPQAKLELEGTIENLLDKKPALYVEDVYKEKLFEQRKSILTNTSLKENIIKADLKAIYVKKNTPANLCSTGEQKSLLLNIILSQARYLKATRGVSPILLLDEISAHLDNVKKDALLSKVMDLHSQCWLTTTNAFDFMNCKSYANFFEIKSNTAKSVVP